MSDSPRARRSLFVWFRNRGVRVQMLSSVLIASVVGIGVGVLGVIALGRTNDATEHMYEDNVRALADAAGMRRATVELVLAVVNQATSLNDTTTSKYEAMVDTDEEEIAALVASYAARDLGPERAEALAAFQDGLSAYLEVVDTKLLPAGRADDLEEWTYVRDTKAAPLIDDMMAALITMEDWEQTSAEETVAAAQTTYAGSRLQVIILLAAGTAVAIALALAIATSLMRSITRVQHVCEALQRKDLTVTAALRYRDEIGSMGAALDEAVGSLREVVTTIDHSSGSLASAAEEMAATTTQIASTAEETAAQAGVVSAAAEQVSASIQTVAVGAEQMGASIQEIASNATSAAQVARTAVTAAESTSETMSRLGDSSREIGNVVKLITSIAEQTNLLALNATIEAARAGAAGKGFAVVAGEVKELAQETARATEEIARRVDAIQDDTTGAVSAMTHITEIIGSINDYQLTIASAVEEQTATTTDIGRNVGEAATGSGEIATNIAGVARAADLTTSGVEQSRQAVAALAEMSTELKTLVGAFRV